LKAIKISQWTAVNAELASKWRCLLGWLRSNSLNRWHHEIDLPVERAEASEICTTELPNARIDRTVHEFGQKVPHCLVSLAVGVTRKVSLPAAEVGDLIQDLGFARLTMIPPQQFASTSPDHPPTTRNPSVQVVAGRSGSFMLSLLNARYGWLGFQMRTQSWQALAKQVADVLGEADSRSSTPH